MDPNKALDDIRSALVTLVGNDELPSDVALLVESVNALDLWLIKGGFLPDNWRQPVVPAYGKNPLVDEMLHVVFTTAFEGGVGYWAASSTYKWSLVVDGKRIDDLEGFHSDVQDADGEDAFKPGRIDRSVVAKGFELVHAGPVEGMHETIRAKFLTMLTARLAGYNDDRVDIDFDAGDADCLVQAGFLGSVVFG